ncbi:MAG: hypothetical protein BLM47_08965 [Candidatus Reconcilbacillus cellulovorans]|uniref:Uncharacterized protein n=1 Tax=Candidatus Reconcilbacillus cellulovorans TaxID=1906605 RepID=A0A2A6DZ64_9BACL|nr:MAG: hypothetical protein BLM47_08965 [Candidatus Reconcilbacillus cellulovorans]
MNAIECAEAAEWMQRLIDSDLNREKERVLLRHLDGCDACRKRFERLMSVDEQLRRLPKVEPPFSLVDAVLPMLDRIGASAAPPSPVAARSEPRQETVKKASVKKASLPVARWIGLLPYGLAGVAAAVVVFVALGLFGSDSGGDKTTTLGTDAVQPSAADGSAAAGVQSSTRPNDFLNQADVSDDGEPESSAAPKFVKPAWPSPPEEDEATEAETLEPKKTPRPSEPAVTEPTASGRSGLIVGTTAPVAASTGNRPSDSDAGAPSGGDAAALGRSSAADGEPSTSPGAAVLRQMQTPTPSSPASSSGGTTGVAGIGSAVTPAREGWVSPDGRWTAAVENGRLVVRRSETGEAVFRSRLSWEADAAVQGRWTDADTFSYTVTAGGQTFRYVVDMKTYMEVSTD